MHGRAVLRVLSELVHLYNIMMIMIVYPREAPPHTRTARAQPPAAHRRRHSRPPPPQTRGTQSHSAPTPLKRPKYIQNIYRYVYRYVFRRVYVYVQDTYLRRYSGCVFVHTYMCPTARCRAFSASRFTCDVT